MESGQNEPKKGFFQRMQDWVRAHPRVTSIFGVLILLLLVGFLIPVDPPHVAISGEKIFSNGPAWLTNSVVGTVIVDIILILGAFLVTRGMSFIPGRVQSFVEVILEYMYNLSESVAGKDARRFFPWVMTIFLFIIISNWSGLIPGVGSIGVYQPYEGSHGTEEIHSEEGGEGAPADEHDSTEGDDQGYRLDGQLAMANGDLILVQPSSVEPAPAAAEEGETKFIPIYRAPSADLNVTFALALVTMVMVQVFGVQALGAGYFGKFFTWRGENIGMKLINGFVGILELISEFSRLVAFGFRLFGNIFAGEIILATMAFLITFLLPVPFYVLEVFVGFIQALVFMMLALVFFSMATVSHDAEHH
jgi:F-type H+-transporting ATPase subunit a